MVDEIRKYDSVSTFFNDCEGLLMRRECENNVILGICNANRDKTIDPNNFLLIAAVQHDGTIVSCALSTPHRTSLATFIPQIEIAIQPLANYFIHQQINVKGLSGETAAVKCFLEFYPKSTVQSNSLVLYKAEMLNRIKLAENTTLTLATMEDLSILTIWSKQFSVDVGLRPLDSDDELQAAVEDKIKKELFYKLVFSDTQQLVSMLAIARQIANYDLISWVYTPSDLRNQGFATTAVYKLTELVLNVRKKQCALFADEANPASNKMYQNIGFQRAAEFYDVSF